MGQLEKSVQADGWIGAITVAADGETFDGSARIEVAAATGFDDAIVIRSDGSRPIVHIREDIPTADDPRALRLGIAANAIASHNLEWDPAVLTELSQEIDLSTFWTKEEIGALLEQEIESGGGDDVPEVEEGPTRTNYGELWACGRHRVLVGDNRRQEDIDRLLQGEQPTALITDPPYGIDASSMTMGTAEAAKPKEARLSFGQSWDSERPDIAHLMSCAEWVCIWGGNYFADVLPPTNHWLCWHKKNDGLSFSEFELAWTNYGTQARHLSHHWGGEEKEHITQKPIEVMLFSIDKCPDASVVFDPYLGSGTTLIACERTGRRCFGLELECRYVDVILKRFLAETGIEPVLLTTGLTAERIDTLCTEAL